MVSVPPVVVPAVPEDSRLYELDREVRFALDPEALLFDLDPEAPLFALDLEVLFARDRVLHSDPDQVDPCALDPDRFNEARADPKEDPAVHNEAPVKTREANNNNSKSNTNSSNNPNSNSSSNRSSSKAAAAMPRLSVRMSDHKTREPVGRTNRTRMPTRMSKINTMMISTRTETTIS